MQYRLRINVPVTIGIVDAPVDSGNQAQMIISHRIRLLHCQAIAIHLDQWFCWVYMLVGKLVAV